MDWDSYLKGKFDQWSKAIKREFNGRCVDNGIAMKIFGLKECASWKKDTKNKVLFMRIECGNVWV